MRAMPPIYSVHVFCSCGDVHPVPIGVSSKVDLGGDPNRLGDKHAGVRVPRSSVKIMSVGVECPATGATVAIEDNDDVFLVRTSNAP